uniref:Uncharacterized protein n=1 Tax=Romanomermis culicivorax TaxID=13658 RepID=A0A915IEN2_ROMCU
MFVPQDEQRGSEKLDNSSTLLTTKKASKQSNLIINLWFLVAKIFCGKPARYGNIQKRLITSVYRSSEK